MKLIIDIPDNIYYAIKKAQTIISGQRSGKTLLQILVNSVENGTPLDDVKAEIREQQKEYQEWGWAYDDVLEILDNIGKADMRGENGM
jgi:hypothetical protein